MRGYVSIPLPPSGCFACRRPAFWRSLGVPWRLKNLSFFGLNFWKQTWALLARLLGLSEHLGRLFRHPLAFPEASLGSKNLTLHCKINNFNENGVATRWTFFFLLGAHRAPKGSFGARTCSQKFLKKRPLVSQRSRKPSKNIILPCVFAHSGSDR